MEVLYPRCAGLDVHKATVVAAVRLAAGGRVAREVRTFATTTAGLLGLVAWLAENGCTHIVMETTGVYCRRALYRRPSSAFRYSDLPRLRPRHPTRRPRFFL